MDTVRSPHSTAFPDAPHACLSTDERGMIRDANAVTVRLPLPER